MQTAITDPISCTACHRGPATINHPQPVHHQSAHLHIVRAGTCGPISLP